VSGCSRAGAPLAPAAAAKAVKASITPIALEPALASSTTELEKAACVTHSPSGRTGHLASATSAVLFFAPY
jgi:hypothetical protein